MREKTKIEALEIYDYIKDYLPLIPIMKLNKDEYLFKAEYSVPALFYIISGRVKVEAVSYNGKKMIVDVLDGDEFTGAISVMHGKDFQCSGRTVSEVKVLVLKESLLNELMQMDEFSAFFYRKTSKRIYRMYKKTLAKSLYSLKEIVAHYILENADGDVFRYVSMYDMCEKLGVSRRGIYNILYQFETEGFIKKTDRVWRILDRQKLEQEARQVLDFMGEGEDYG